MRALASVLRATRMAVQSGAAVAEYDMARTRRQDMATPLQAI
jgi:hypothetical protein